MELSGILEGPLEHTLGKPREIQGILEYSRAARDIGHSYRVPLTNSNQLGIHEISAQ